MGLSISTDGQIATVTDDQVLKVFDARDLTAKTVPSLRHAMSRLPVDVAFAGQHDMFVLTEVRYILFVAPSSICLHEKEWSCGRECGCPGLRRAATQKRPSL